MNAKILAVLLASVIGVSASAGIFVRTTYVQDKEQPIVMEVVDDTTNQVLDTYTFRPDGDGIYILDTVVGASSKDEPTKESQSVDVPIASVGSAPNSDTTSNDNGVSVVETTDVSTTVVSDSSPVVQEEGAVHEPTKQKAWDAVRNKLKESAAKLEVLYESVKTKMSSMRGAEPNPANPATESEPVAEQAVETVPQGDQQNTADVPDTLK